MAYNSINQDDPDELSESESSHLVPSPIEDLEHDRRGRRSPNLEYQSSSSYPDAMDQSDHAFHPATKTVSRDGSVLRHPTPDLQSLQGAYSSNVERLERSAERLSMSSSGIDEELRKMREEQRQSDSRRSSRRSSVVEDDDRSFVLQKQSSFGYGSHASSSIVGTNNVARSGGFSPAAYFASPRGSVRSGSWSQHTHTSNKERSGSYGPRLRQVSEPEREGKPLDSPISSRLVAEISEPEQEGKPLDSPLSSRLVPLSPDIESEVSPASPLRVVNSENYNLNDVEIPHTQSAVSEVPETGLERHPSTDTFRQAKGLFADFDGVHTDYHSDNEDHVGPGKPIGSRKTSQPRPTSRPASRLMSYIEPIPGENMVYYPAPVPMMLNLPKRLSKLPSGLEREKRRTQLLNSIPQNNRKSAAWLPDMTAGSDGASQPGEDLTTQARPDKRRTVGSMPPQLRATMFFDQPAPHEDVQLQGDSAVATLDSILDASAFAPVSAFTDHPFAGRVGPEVYGKETKRTRASVVPIPQKRRSTINLLSRRNSMDLLDDEGRRTPNVLRKRNSNPTLLGTTSRRNSSLLSLGGIGNRQSSGQDIQGAQDEEEVEAAERRADAALLQSPTEDREIIAAEDEYYQDGPEGEEEPQLPEHEAHAASEDFIGAPTTLLAELQMRKQQQKLRNRTAATNFPNGMHATLMQMDAVEQIQKQKRKQKHTRLAWEDPNALHDGLENDDDEDVPLGMLFAGKQLDSQEKARRLDESRPLGLIAMRQMEDNEPLSHRRARLRGEELVPQHHPQYQEPQLDKRRSQYTLDLPYLGGNDLSGEPATAESKPTQEDDNENETLAQRRARMKATKIPIQPRAVSGDFASEMMSQIGGSHPAEQPSQKQQPDTARNGRKTPDPDETLAQRRKRLQSEAEAKDNGHDGANDTPTVSKRRSMADILQAHPAAGAGSTPAMRAISNEIKFAPAPRTRNTSWAINQTRQASMGTALSVANGLAAHNGVNGAGGKSNYFPHPMVQSQIEVDPGRRDMIDRWRQSIHY